MDPLEFELEPGPDAPHEARRLIRRRLVDDLPAPVLYDLLMVMSELVTNSVGHGPGTTIAVRLELTGDGALRGEVADGGSPVIDFREIGASMDTGLGLRIVDAIADRWGVADDRSAVFFELRVA